MSGDDIAVIRFHRLSKERLRAGKNGLTIGCGREVVYACGRMDEVVVRS